MNLNVNIQKVKNAKNSGNRKKTRKSKKRKQKSTQENKWRKQRKRALHREYPHLLESTLTEYTYRIERIVLKLATEERRLRLKSGKWHKTKKHIITLKGQPRLQRQSRNKTTVTVIDLETGKRMELSFRALLIGKS